jgi:hypothetical protein
MLVQVTEAGEDLGTMKTDMRRGITGRWVEHGSHDEVAGGMTTAKEDEGGRGIGDG